MAEHECDTIWFTADTHFNHDKIIEHAGRPFKSVDDMNDEMISQWNDRVKPGDIVYHLGDFALTFGKTRWHTVGEILVSLNGQKWLIRGNHDRDEVVKSHFWVDVKDYHEINVDLGGEHKQPIVMSHYAMRVWNRMHYGAWMLHGHSHGNLEDIGGTTMDVGVDCNGFRPISLGEVAEYMATRQPVVVDHHA